MHDSFTPWFDMANDKWRFGISEDGAGTQFALVLQRQPAADRMVAANFVFKLGKHLPKLEIDGQPSQIDRRVSIDGSHIFGMDESTESMHLWSPKQMALLQTSPNEWRLQTCGVLGYKTSDAETPRWDQLALRDLQDCAFDDYSDIENDHRDENGNARGNVCVELQAEIVFASDW
jgi:hypothetical protein